MDGLSGSMSYNFLERGWHGVLVEPFPQHFAAAVRNTRVFGHFRNQSVTYVNAAVDSTSGPKRLFLFDENSHTSNSLKQQGHTFGKKTGWNVKRPGASDVGDVVLVYMPSGCIVTSLEGTTMPGSGV